MSFLVGAAGGTADLINPQLVALGGRPAADATAGGVLAVTGLLALRLPTATPLDDAVSTLKRPSVST